MFRLFPRRYAYTRFQARATTKKSSCDISSKRLINREDFFAPFQLLLDAQIPFRRLLASTGSEKDVAGRFALAERKTRPASR